MNVILYHRDYDPDHLAEIAGEMATRGAPEIRGVWSEVWGAWVALEGAHRLRAAHALGLIPRMVEVEYDDETTAGDLGLDMDAPNRIRDVVDDAWRDAVILEWADGEDAARRRDSL